MTRAPHRGPSRASQAAVLGAAALVLSACGSEPAPLQAMQPDVPADLCSTVPAAARAGLQTASSTDTTGAATAACSLRSGPGARPEVRALVTWTRLDDDGTADDVLASQCRAIDTAAYTVQPNYTAQGADKACAGSGKLGAAGAATLAAVTGTSVVTVRWSTVPPGGQSAMAQATQVLEGVLKSLSA